MKKLLLLAAMAAMTATAACAALTSPQSWPYVPYEQRDAAFYDQDPTATKKLRDLINDPTSTQVTHDIAQELLSYAEKRRDAGCRFTIATPDIDSEQTFWRHQVEAYECAKRASTPGPYLPDDICPSYDSFRKTPGGSQYGTTEACERYQAEACTAS